MMARLFLMLSLLASAINVAPGAEVTRDPIPTIRFKSTEPPYCVGTADPACFRLEVEPATIKLSSRDEDMSFRYTLRYTRSTPVQVSTFPPPDALQRSVGRRSIPPNSLSPRRRPPATP